MTRSGQAGFTYLWLLFAVAGMGLLLAAAAEVWDTAARREKEAELLFIGDQFARAIAAYHAHSPGAAKQYPEKLEDLLEDKRLQAQPRHLRKIFRDPMTNSAEWGLVKAGGRIVGVHSRSAGKPIRTRFIGRFAALSGAASYAEWVFGGEQAVLPVVSAETQPAAPDQQASGSDTPPSARDNSRMDACGEQHFAAMRQCESAPSGSAERNACQLASARRFAACLQGG
jgi:type II secretory pathway pseudopilin PulG